MSSKFYLERTKVGKSGRKTRGPHVCLRRTRKILYSVWYCEEWVLGGRRRIEWLYFRLQDSCRIFWDVLDWSIHYIRGETNETRSVKRQGRPETSTGVWTEFRTRELARETDVTVWETDTYRVGEWRTSFWYRLIRSCGERGGGTPRGKRGWTEINRSPTSIDGLRYTEINK